MAGHGQAKAEAQPKQRRPIEAPAIPVPGSLHHRDARAA
jgi:hypothetical protein